MPNELRIKSEHLAPLAGLSVIQQGPAAYYRQLRFSKDVYIQVGAWCALLEGKYMARPFWDEVLPFCRYGAVRSRAFTYFKGAHDRDYALQAASTMVTARGDVEQAAMLAELNFDAPHAARAAADLYLATGDIVHLGIANEQAEIEGGWREALQWAIRALAIAPLSGIPLRWVFVVLESAVRPELTEELAELLVGRKMHLPIMPIFLAMAALQRGDAELCLKRLQPLEDAKVLANPLTAPYLGGIRAMRAQAEEKLGHYRRAYESYAALMAAERNPDVDPERYYKGIAIRNKLAVPPNLPPDEHNEVVQMLGFPRSGTTLLENILNAHPQIETFEEIPSLVVAIDRVERVILGKTPPESPEATFLAARAKYYGEVELRRRKPDTRVLIDKMPIRTAEADFIAKLFPEWRYIFSIRHPFDVVLSCFKQRFRPNPAMENFRTIEGSIRLYDFAMTEWFNRHTLDDPKVKYVRYDELVTDFESVSRGVFDFLGLPWDDAVRDFAAAAENRAARTPSYAKVRQGLSIGVQTQWRNYAFLFDTPAAAPLRKWAQFFGYEIS